MLVMSILVKSIHNICFLLGFYSCSLSKKAASYMPAGGRGGGGGEGGERACVPSVIRLRLCK